MTTYKIKLGISFHCCAAQIMIIPLKFQISNTRNLQSRGISPNAAGTTPENLFPFSLIYFCFPLFIPILPMVTGNPPSKSLFARYNLSSSFMFPISSGSLPFKRLLCTSRYSSAGRPLVVLLGNSSLGRDPVRWLSSSSSIAAKEEARCIEVTSVRN